MDPDDVAATLRSQLGIDLQTHEAWLTNYNAFNAWKNGMERVGVLVFHFEGVEVTEARGFSHPEFPLPFVAVNGKDSPLARAFTLLHEYCHLLINAGGVCDTVERTKVRGEDDSIETFCNHVAGAALVPSMSLLNHPLVRRHRDAESWEDWELRELSVSFKASREVVLRRLLILGRASRVFYEQYREQLLRQPHKKKPFRFPYPRRVLRRIGQPYARTVIGAYYADRITGNELADYLGASLKHLPAIEALLEGPNVLTGGDR
jgi:Zn-dependent peptidase ImmA (M78 family)